MAGLYLTFDAAPEARLDAVAQHLRYGGESEVRYAQEISYLWQGHDMPIRYAPAHDPDTGVHVIVAGRLVWSAEEWGLAASVPGTGGSANRLLLQRYLAKGVNGVVPFNGAAMIVIWDPRERSVHLWTDQMGYHPCFLYRADEGRRCIITSYPDAIAADPAADVSPDLVSMAEFLRAWRVTPPHTYYSEVLHAGAATYHRWNLDTGSHESREYWRPFDEPFFESLEAASEALATAVTAAIHDRTAVVDNNAAIFISGGADSRVLLFAAADPARLVGVNLYERPTNESAIARALCEKVGCRYLGYGRDNDYYPRLLQENVRWSGAMWSAEDSHYLGVHKVIKDTGADLVMTACTTDWVFKGYGLEKRYIRLLGRNLPLKTYTSERVDGFLPNPPLSAPAEFQSTIAQRMNAWFAGTPRELISEKDRALVEDRRIRPTSYTVSVSGQMMYRIYPYDTFLADSRVAACYGRIPPKWKLNGEVWGHAATRICAGAGNIVDSNFGWRLDAGKAAKLLAFARGWVGRRLRPKPAPQEADDSHPPSSASWPDLGWYARHSATLKIFWEATPTEHRARMRRVWGSDPWAQSLEEWSDRYYDLFRILTLLAHWRVLDADVGARVG